MEDRIVFPFRTTKRPGGCLRYPRIPLLAQLSSGMSSSYHSSKKYRQSPPIHTSNPAVQALNAELNPRTRSPKVASSSPGVRLFFVRIHFPPRSAGCSFPQKAHEGCWSDCLKTHRFGHDVTDFAERGSFFPSLYSRELAVGSIKEYLK